MDNLSPQNLKAILHSKRANIFYLEKCRVMQKSGRVLHSQQCLQNFTKHKALDFMFDTVKEMSQNAH